MSTDGTIGVLTVGSDEFEVKHHAKHYHSWRLGGNSDYMRHPVLPPSIKDVGFNGAVKYPYVNHRQYDNNVSATIFVKQSLIGEWSVVIENKPQSMFTLYRPGVKTYCHGVVIALDEVFNQPVT